MKTMSAFQRVRHLIATVLLVVAAVAAAPVAAIAQQPSRPAAQDGFVPVDELRPEDQLPAAPLLIAAYIIAWLAILFYVWSIWQRLNRVQREIADVSRRIGGGGARR